LNPQLKHKTYHNPRYLAYVRTKRSIKSGRAGTANDPMVAAHQRLFDGGTALKPSDTCVVPLLWSEHQQVEHQHGAESFYAGMDVPLRCLQMFTEFMSLNKGRKI